MKRLPAGGIDKINGYFFSEQNIETIKERAAASGLPTAIERLGKKRAWALRVGRADGEHIYLKLGRFDATHSRKLLSNPNHFRTFRRFEEFLVRLFGRNEYEFLQLCRLDVCVDVVHEFEEFLKWVRVPYKQIRQLYLEKGRARTGIYFGNKPVVIVIYNKTAEQLQMKKIDLGRPVTRVEVRYYDDKVPVHFVRELPSILGLNKNGGRFNPFSKISIEPIVLHPLESLSKPPLTTDRAVDRLISRVRLQAFLEVGGYDLAYRLMNVNNNFRRDLPKLARFEEYPHDFNAILTRQVERFFGRSTRRPGHDF